MGQLGKFWIITETLRWCNAQTGTVNSVTRMYAGINCIRTRRSCHAFHYWGRLQLRPHWSSCGARRPGMAPGSPPQPCWVCIPRSLAWFSAWASSFWCLKTGPWQRISVFQPCVVKLLQFLQSVCVFSTLATGTPETHTLEHQWACCPLCAGGPPVNFLSIHTLSRVWTSWKGLLLTTVRFRCTV